MFRLILFLTNVFILCYFTVDDRNLLTIYYLYALFSRIEGVSDSIDNDRIMRIFFLKAKLTKNEFDADVCQFGEIRWCTKAQVKELVAPKYFLAIENLLNN